MKHILTLTLVLYLPALALGAQMMLTSGGNSIGIDSPGAVQRILVSVDTQGTTIAGFKLKLHGSTGGYLTISGWSFDPAFEFNSGTLNGNLSTDTGPATGLSYSNLGPGIVNLGIFTVTTSLYAPTSPWSLTIVNPLLSDSDAQPVPVQVTPFWAIPEPMSLLLLAMGATLLRRRH